MFLSTKIDAAFLSSFSSLLFHLSLLLFSLCLLSHLLSFRPFLPLPPPLPQALAVGQKLPVSTFNFNHTQCILYALGVGMSTKDPDHLRYVFVLKQTLGVNMFVGGVCQHV